MDDERLKRTGGGEYFDELLARIRDIRSSEKVFWRKVLEIYATSSDYDRQHGPSQKFFATVQNKIHWARARPYRGGNHCRPRRCEQTKHGVDAAWSDPARKRRTWPLPRII